MMEGIDQAWPVLEAAIRDIERRWTLVSDATMADLVRDVTPIATLPATEQAAALAALQARWRHRLGSSDEYAQDKRAGIEREERRAGDRDG